MSSSSAYAFRIADQESVVYIAEHLLQHCYKKRPELQTLLDYRKYDVISGNEVQTRFKQFVYLDIRERHGSHPIQDIPWSFSVGYKLSRKGRALLTHGLGKKLSESQKQEARERHNVFGETISALSRAYGVSRSMIWRTLRNE